MKQVLSRLLFVFGLYSFVICTIVQHLKRRSWFGPETSIKTQWLSWILTVVKSLSQYYEALFVSRLVYCFIAAFGESCLAL